MSNSFIEFNGKNTLEEGFQIVKYSLGQPTLKYTSETVPYCNGEYDFSMLNGIQYYNSRKLTITLGFKEFNIFSLNQNELQNETIYLKYFKFKSFLLSSKKSVLDISNLIGFEGTLNAKCIDVSGLMKGNFGGEFTITFDCDPLIFIGNYGEDIWDTFNFLFDVTEYTNYTINGSQTLNIFNVGVATVPEITVSSECTLILNNNQYTLSPNCIPRIILEQGINELNITGFTTININFKKEVI